MTSQSENNPVSRWRRMAVAGVASTGLAVSVAMGVGTATANADVLDDLAQQYSLGAGAGQVANLLNTSLRLRSQGFKPTQPYLDQINQSLSYKPNQVPLINALKQTIAFQQKEQSQSQPPSSGGGYTIGINQYDPNNPGVLGGFGVSGPNGGVGIGNGGIGISGGS
jgi:hypothetical protein